MPRRPSLVVRAGATARRRIRESGFDPDLFGTLLGASGGPKWLVLRHLDEVWAEQLMARRSRPLDTLGSSIGSFRHACLAQRDPRAALSRFGDAYVEQRYDGRPGLHAVSRESERIVGALLGEKGAGEIVANPAVRSHFVATRLRRGPRRDRGVLFRLRLAAAAAANAASRRSLGLFFERGVFETAASDLRYRDLTTAHYRLEAGQVAPALLASGSIPLVMEGVASGTGAPGVWFDGGLLDYHFDFAFERAQGLVLFPHFFDRITPGWFDKPLHWRRPDPGRLDDVLMVAPSAAFVASLPGGRVPDRGDFARLPDGARIRQWREVLARGRELADEWVDLVDGGRLGDALEPFA